MIFSLLIFSIVLIPIVLLTYKIKNPILRWCFIIIPPLFVVFLYWIPFDILTTAFWLPASIAFLWSVISLLINIVRIIVRGLRKRLQIKFVKTRFLRPSLTIVIFLTVTFLVHKSLLSANKYGIEVAKKIQAIVEASGVCPEKIQGWEVDKWDPNKCTTRYGKYGAKYPIRYMLSQDRKEFTIVVYYNFEEGLFVTGGVNLELKAVHSGPDEAVDVPIE
jgi:hypothetical protein